MIRCKQEPSAVSDRLRKPGKKGKLPSTDQFARKYRAPFIPELVSFLGYSLTFHVRVIAQPFAKINGVRTDLTEKIEISKGKIRGLQHAQEIVSEE